MDENEEKGNSITISQENFQKILNELESIHKTFEHMNDSLEAFNKRLDSDDFGPEKSEERRGRRH